MSNPELEALVADVDSLRACLVIEAQSGRIAHSYRREPVQRDFTEVARVLAEVSRAHGEVHEHGETTQSTVLEWPDGSVVMRAAGSTALLALFFDEGVKLGLARLHSVRIARELGDLIPRTATPTVLEMPAVQPPRPQVSAEPAPAEPPRPQAPAEPAPAQPTASVAAVTTAPEAIDGASSQGRKLLAYLDENAPDTHAALLRVSLQTGLPLSLLKNPDELSATEFTQVTQSVQRILGVEQLAL